MDALQQLFNSYPLLLLVASGILGLIVGSFLNVVIHRLPLMMDREWHSSCAELRGEAPPQTPSLNLVYPPSHCPNCHHRIRAWENIPVISYLLQAGRCTGCHQPVSLRYPAVEILSAALAVVAAWHFGFDMRLAMALLLTWALLALSFIDIDRQLLPDDMTQPLLWLGLICNFFSLYVPLEEAVVGAIIGYMTLWTVYMAFKLITGKEGMGFGDFKLLAALGAWLGWQMLPAIILISSLIGAIFGTGMIILAGRDRQQPIPFGPYLALAGWCCLIWGDTIQSMYLTQS